MTDEIPEVNTQAATVPVAEWLNDISNWLPESVLPAWQAIYQYPILGAVVIAVIFYLAAVVFRSLLVNVLGRLTRLTRSSSDDIILHTLRKPIFTTVFFFGLFLAVTVAQLPFGGPTLINIIVSVIVASWMGASLKISTTVLEAFSGESRFELIEERTVPIFDLTTKLLIILIGSYALLLIWGINPIGWLASAGIVGIAVGFAAKDSLANLFSGFFIVADAPYKIGDYINLDTGERGKVSGIGLRSTRLITRDDVEITIPNGVIANAKIINESGGPSSKMRIRIVVGVAYGSDVDLVDELLMQVGAGHYEVCQQPTPTVRLRAFGASSLDFNLMCWIEHPQDRGRISHELNVLIYRLFAEHNIEIPYAKQDIHIKEWPKD